MAISCQNDQNSYDHEKGEKYEQGRCEWNTDSHDAYCDNRTTQNDACGGQDPSVCYFVRHLLTSCEERECRCDPVDDELHCDRDEQNTHKAVDDPVLPLTDTIRNDLCVQQQDIGDENG